MLTLYHAPQSRSTRVVTLLEELGATYTLKTVTIPRRDGSGGRDPANPHPEGKVPLLIDGDTVVWETAAIFLYLTDLHPEAGLGPRIGDPSRGTYLSWLSYYGGVMEPAMVLSFTGGETDATHATFRGMTEVLERIESTLCDGRTWLLGERYTAADLLCASPFLWFPEIQPETPVIRDWIARAADRPATRASSAADAAHISQMAG